MKRLLVITQEELDTSAKDLAGKIGKDFTYKRWEIEISAEKYPRLIIYVVDTAGTEFSFAYQLKLG